MASYSISYLERLSGIKAGTIRIWEQRYGLLKPDRSEGNIRFYDDDQLRKLLNVTTLLDSGLKISEICDLKENEINKKILNISLEPNHKINNEAKLNDLLIAALSYDEQKFNSIYNKAVLQNGLHHTYLSLIHPLLTRIGFLWGAQEMIPAQEHFISNLLRQKLFSAIDSLPVTKKKAQTWILYLPEHEAHEIGLLFAAFLLKESGKKIIYLGQKVPFSNLELTVQQTQANGILTFFVSKIPDVEIKEYIKNCATKFKKQEMVFCLNKEIAEQIDKKKNISLISQPNALYVWLNSIHELKKKS